MKGFMIYEDYRGKEVVEAIKLDGVNYKCESVTSDDIWINELRGIRMTSTQANCNKEDTYDFETGALIALMKMCGVEKVTKACDELYKDDNYKNALQEMTENCEKLMKEKEQIIVAKNILYNNLREEHERLEEEKKHLEDKYERCQHILDAKVKDIHRLKEENEKLQHEYDLCLNSENALKITTQLQNKSIEKLTKAIDGYKNDLYEVAKHCRELEAKEDILNKQEETRNNNEYKYLESFSVVRRNSKQYESLYKESYGKWCQQWIKPPTKREEMWNKIFELHKEDDIIIKVKKEDINTFLHEIETKFPEITWRSTVKIFKTKYTIKDIYIELKRCDELYFKLSKETKLSYSSDEFIYAYKGLKPIDYLPPMRWDLFKKGRLIVKVNADNYEDFYNKCEVEIGRKPRYVYRGETFTVYYKYGYHTRPYKDTIPYAKKIVDWEDVR